MFLLYVYSYLLYARSHFLPTTVPSIMHPQIVVVMRVLLRYTSLGFLSRDLIVHQTFSIELWPGDGHKVVRLLVL